MLKYLLSVTVHGELLAKIDEVLLEFPCMRTILLLLFPESQSELMFLLLFDNALQPKDLIFQASIGLGDLLVDFFLLTQQFV